MWPGVGTTFVLTRANQCSHGWLQRASRAVLGLGIATVYGVTVVASEGLETRGGANRKQMSERGRRGLGAGIHLYICK